MAEAALVLGAAATWAMVGVVWFVQVVHYPMLRLAAGPGFADVAGEHGRRTGRVVVVPMLVEGATAILLVVSQPDGVPAAAAWAAAGLLAAIWILTALVQVPQHARLRRGFDPATHRSLVLANWPRTILWSARGAVMAGMVAAAL